MPAHIPAQLNHAAVACPVLPLLGCECVHGALLLLCTCTLASLAHLNVHFEHTQVRKAVHSGTAVAVVVAVDIQETSLRAGQPGAEVAETCQLAEARGIPVVFALSRVGLGSIFGASKRMSGEELSRWAQDKRRGPYF